MTRNIVTTPTEKLATAPTLSSVSIGTMFRLNMHITPDICMKIWASKGISAISLENPSDTWSWTDNTAIINAPIEIIKEVTITSNEDTK